jgi:pantoate--beta-alanine ligase
MSIYVPAALQRHIRARFAERLAQGERQGARLTATLRDCIAQEPLARLDYVAVCDPDTLREVEQLSGTVLVALAVYIGKTRLIDNAVVKVGD